MSIDATARGLAARALAIAASGSLVIGSPISGGTDKRVPFNSGGVLSDSSSLTFDNATNTLGVSGFVGLSGTAYLRSTSPGWITLLNAAQTGFGALNFGGETSSFPALARSGAGLVVRLADATANADITAANGTFSGISLPSFTDKHILFNDAGVVRGSAGLTFDKATGLLLATRFQAVNNTISPIYNISSATGYISWGDLYFYRDSANISAQRNGTNAQGARIYNTYTDASNGEWATFDWTTTPNTLTIGTKANGTGTVRSLGIDIGANRAITWDTNGIFTAGRIGAGNGITTNDPFTIQQRMNASGVAFTLMKLNFEDQSSASGSMFFDVQYTGTSVASFRKASTVGGTVFVLGNSLGSDPDPAMVIGRGVNSSNGSGNAHGIAENTAISRTGVIGYASFDGAPAFSGSTNFDHYAAFQARATYSMAGTIAADYGLYSTATVNTGAIITARYAAYVADASIGGGSIGTQYGFYVAALSAGSSANYGIYVAGNNPSVFGGDVRLSSGAKLRLGNAYAAGAPAATGYVTIYDSTGTAYKVLVST